MKMLYILNTTNRVNNFSFSSMQAARNLGIEFHIAGNWTGYKNNVEIYEDEIKYGIKIYQVDFIRNPFDPRNVKAYRQIKELIRKEKYDFIHCNTPIGGVIGRIAGWNNGVKKIIYQAHGFHFYKGSSLLSWLVYYPVERVLAHMTDILITINEEDYEVANKFKLHKKGRVYFVPGVGIDLSDSSLTDNKPNNIEKKDMGIPENAEVLISVGELNENKNNQIIIEVLHHLNKNDIYYLICGEGTSKRKLQELVHKYKLEKNVLFLGYRKDVIGLLKIADIFVMPSLREGLSRSIMEAMAVGKPCIVSDIRGNRDLIKEFKGGYLCNPKDSLMFVKAINNLTNNKEQISEMGDYNLQRIKQYDVDIVIEKLKGIYAYLLEELEQD